MPVTVDTSDLDRLVIELGAAAPRVGAKLANAVRKAGADIEARAKIAAPVDTGHLRSTIGSVTEGDGRNSAMTVTVSAAADYAAAVEFGHRYKSGGKDRTYPPRPFMIPAFDEVVTELVDAIESIMGEL